MRLNSSRLFELLLQPQEERAVNPHQVQCHQHAAMTVVIFQHANRPGSLLAILQEFAARAINLTKLESRPTKEGLGSYCFIMDLEGHVDDELVADCLRDIHSKHGRIKFLGSYPAAGETGERVRREADASWAEAESWIQSLKDQIRP